MRSLLLRAMNIYMCMLICSCASGPKPFAIKGEGERILNQDISGKSLSVVVRIYQLRDALEFSKLTFDTLAAGYSDSELFGASLLARSEIILVPGGTHAISEKLLDETRYIGVVGLFRNPDPHHWRQLVDARDVKSYGGNSIAFRAKNCHIVIEGAKAVPLPGQPPFSRGECGTARVAPAIEAGQTAQQRGAQLR